tara:strand:+ start:2617 stop:3363 length:747 start_codon:yes stop_codon:yes gene_type:complete
MRSVEKFFQDCYNEYPYFEKLSGCSTLEELNRKSIDKLDMKTNLVIKSLNVLYQLTNLIDSTSNKILKVSASTVFRLVKSDLNNFNLFSDITVKGRLITVTGYFIREDNVLKKTISTIRLKTTEEARAWKLSSEGEHYIPSVMVRRSPLLKTYRKSIAQGLVKQSNLNIISGDALKALKKKEKEAARKSKLAEKRSNKSVPEVVEKVDQRKARRAARKSQEKLNAPVKSQKQKENNPEVLDFDISQFF